MGVDVLIKNVERGEREEGEEKKGEKEVEKSREH